MKAQLQKKCVKDLTVGMYVASLDKPCSQTPFPMEGFYIRSTEDLAELSRHCTFVVINITKGRAMRELKSTLQLDIVDIPSAIKHGGSVHDFQQVRPRRAVKKSHKGRTKRLATLLIFCLIVMPWIAKQIDFSKLGIF